MLNRLYSYQPEATVTNEGPVNLQSLMGSVALGAYSEAEAGFGGGTDGADGGTGGGASDGGGE